MKNAIVTGMSKGIGKAIALQLATDGFRILGTYNKDRAGALDCKKQIIHSGGECEIYRMDQTKTSSIKNFISAAGLNDLKVDLLVNNAGKDYDITIEDYPLDKLEEIVRTNLIGPMILTKLSLPALKRSKNSPQIINISSRVAQKKIFTGVGIYAPSKAGIVRFTQTCALELSKYGIRANAVCPGFTPTNAYRQIYPDPAMFDQVVKEVSKANPCKRVTTVEDVANTVSFLASEKATYINGEAIVIDGGGNLV